eukprot:31195-Pelagococcus_subviridis.AAC.5
MCRAKSLRNGVHHANAVVWEPVYRTRLFPDGPAPRLRGRAVRDVVASSRREPLERQRDSRAGPPRLVALRDVLAPRARGARGPLLRARDAVVHRVSVLPLELRHGLRVLPAPDEARLERAERAPGGVVRRRVLHLVRLVRVIVRVHGNGNVLLFAQRRRVANHSRHHLGVHETERVHDADRRPGREVRVPGREPQLEVVPGLVPEVRFRVHAVLHDRHQTKRVMGRGDVPEGRSRKASEAELKGVEACRD